MPFEYAQEEELIRRCQGSDVQALETLIVMHRPFIRSLAMRMNSPSSLLEEIIQAGYVGFIRAIHHFDLSCGVRFLTYAVPWILGEMRRTMRLYLNRMQTLSLEETVSAEGQTLGETISGEKDIGIAYINLRFALSRLTDEEQLLICLRYYRDYSQTETAVIMKKSQSQISKLESRALDRMRCMLT